MAAAAAILRERSSNAVRRQPSNAARAWRAMASASSTVWPS